VLAVLLNSTLLKAARAHALRLLRPRWWWARWPTPPSFRLIFSEDLGFVNKALAAIGLPEVAWFSSPTAAMALIIMAVTWRWAGYNAIIILSGLQSIPDDVYEAATLDRRVALRQFFFITLPLLKPVILFCVILSVHRHHAALRRALSSSPTRAAPGAPPRRWGCSITGRASSC
jgi:lactose/L-arabinose transport system permease protein